ncbi:hypothetical protein A0H81_13064 [Grifola frondosa]|uniref:Uncharacterized protein n=1 Tax=Grifola frondosa TaxID=5627 RepID=A0A1C7LQH4_GRIFR|nr:hypothetical protein A0H81_13064 [Grifola frondosa]
MPEKDASWLRGSTAISTRWWMDPILSVVVTDERRDLREVVTLAGRLGGVVVMNRGGRNAGQARRMGDGDAVEARKLSGQTDVQRAPALLNARMKYSASSLSLSRHVS